MRAPIQARARRIAAVEQERWRDWAIGRWLLCRGLQQLGITPSVRTTIDGPSGDGGASLSVSHRDGLTAAVVAQPQAGDVGVDLERIDAMTWAALWPMCTPEEIAQIDLLEAQIRPLLGAAEAHASLPSLIFSIKEAGFKALALAGEDTQLRHVGIRLNRRRRHAPAVLIADRAAQARVVQLPEQTLCQVSTCRGACDVWVTLCDGMFVTLAVSTRRQEGYV